MTEQMGRKRRRKLDNKGKQRTGYKGRYCKEGTAEETRQEGWTEVQRVRHKVGQTMTRKINSANKGHRRREQGSDVRIHRRSQHKRKN